MEGAAASGTLEYPDNTADERRINLETAVSGRYIMLVWLSAGGPGGNGNYHANCAELNVYEYASDAQEITIKYNTTVNGVERTIASETRTLGIGTPQYGTKEVGQWIVDYIQKA